MNALQRGLPFDDPDRRATRSTRSRPDPISEQERVAAAQARVAADRLRGVRTEQWIVDIAKAAG